MSEISFDNTEVAFASRSDADLNKSLWLFGAINSPVLVAIGKPLTRLALWLHLPVKALIKGSIFRQFCGGETIEESLLTAEKLGKYQVGSILDYSVEGLDEEGSFDATCSEILRTIAQAAVNKNIPFSVFKVSGLGSSAILEKWDQKESWSAAEKAAFQRTRERVNTICRAAYQAEVPVMMDAEESWIQNAIDSLATQMMDQYNREKVTVINTIQLYRHDRLEYLKQAFRMAEQSSYTLGVKLVRGAYMEKERLRAKKLGIDSPIHADKAATDRDFDLAQEFCLKQKSEILLVSGTHNEQSCRLLANLLEDGRLERNKNTWFAQLLGMSDQLTFNLAGAGFQVAKYLPYGPLKGVMPYLFRRAEENTAIAGQMSREYTLVRTEIRRRRSSARNLK